MRSALSLAASYIRKAFALGLFFFACASTASAQEAFGTLRRAESNLPSQGTVVVAERLSDGQVIARAVTGARGTWQLRLTTEVLVIRALRIGFMPQVLDTVKLAVGERREVNATLAGAQVILPPLVTAADTRCRVRPESASLVATAFHEARTALAASQLISPDGPVRNRVRVIEEVWAADEREMLESAPREYYTNSLRPFRTAPVDSLLEHGFVTRRREAFAIVRPGVEVAVEYRVPSVDLIVDDRFLEDYCLHLVDAPPGHSGWIGVGFRPARSRRITQIQGTLWIDGRSAELRRLEFGYFGLEGSEARLNSGGWLEFSRLERGLWFVSRWSVRVPALGEWLESSGRGSTRVVTRDVPVIRVLGEVLELAVNARTMFSAGATDVLEGGVLVPLATPAGSALPTCTASPTGASLVGWVRSTSGAVLPAAELRFFWREDSGAPDAWVQASSTSQSSGVYRVCEIPRDRLVIVEVRADGYAAAAITVRIGSPRQFARLDMTLEPEGGAPPPR